MKEIEPSGVCPYEPVYSTGKSQKKIRFLKDWVSTDFLEYIDKSLKQHGLTLGVVQQDRNTILRIHDRLAAHIEGFNNRILKEYFEWWIAHYSPHFSGRKVSVYELIKDKYLEGFVAFYNNDVLKLQHNKEVPIPAASDEDIYKLGGLTLLLTRRGIVKAYCILKNDPNAMTSLSKELRKLSKKELEEVLDITLSMQYNNTERVDFLSLARPALTYHNIQKYNSIDYRNLFIRS